MELLNIQIAIFSENEIERPDLILAKINQSMGMIFDAMPIIMNLPKEMPNDMPIAQVSSFNKEHVLGVARKRIDYYINITTKMDKDKTPDDTYQMYNMFIETFYKKVCELIKVVRIGVIFNIFQEAENNVQVIYKKYLKEEYTDEDSEIIVRLNKKTKLKNFIINNVIRIEAGQFNMAEFKRKGVFIQFDINNVPESSKILTVSNLNTIVKYAKNKIKENTVKELL